MEEEWEAVIIGAGPAGLVAAREASERGLKTLIIEKNRKPGVKILMSGGTRCNLTHHTDAAGIARVFPRDQARFLGPSLSALSPDDVVRLFHAEGVETKIESTGKIFPASDRALDVQQALIKRAERAGARLDLGSAVSTLEKRNDGFRVSTPSRDLLAKRLIVASGGKSYPGCGTTGDGYAWLARLGHSIVRPRPSLVPLITSTSPLRDLSGITIPDVVVRVVAEADLVRATDAAARVPLARKTCLAEQRGSLLLAHFGLTGPAALNVSRAVTNETDPQVVRVILDFLPEVGFEECVSAWETRAKSHGARSVAHVLACDLPARLVETLIESVGLQPGQKSAELAKNSWRNLAGHFKAHVLHVTGTRGFEKAEVTAGGVALPEVNPRTLESKIVPGLFIVGEVLDIDGPIGGYNFQAAFSTGFLAARSL